MAYYNEFEHIMTWLNVLWLVWNNTFASLTHKWELCNGMNYPSMWI